MILTKLKCGASIFLMALAAACSSSPQKEDNKNGKTEREQEQVTPENPDIQSQVENDAEEVRALTKNGITLVPAGTDEEFPDAKLSLKSPMDEISEAGKVKFDFQLENFELGAQTKGPRSNEIANSTNGQHIHMIINNGPYMAKYEPSFEVELAEGNNVILAFLSRSYHQSIKHADAYVFTNKFIGETTMDFDESAPHLIYSRPKGTYSGDDINKILLDFYLINTDLSKDGKKVRALIDDQEFIIPSWQPYFVEGLLPGEHTFRLQLIDENNEIVPGPFSDSGYRTISLKSEENQ